MHALAAACPFLLFSVGGFLAYEPVPRLGGTPIVGGIVGGCVRNTEARPMAAALAHDGTVPSTVNALQRTGPDPPFPFDGIKRMLPATHDVM